MDDAKRRKRTATGERKLRTSKLTEQDVREIRSLSEVGATRKALGERFGVVPETIGKIVNGHRWSHLL